MESERETRMNKAGEMEREDKLFGNEAGLRSLTIKKENNCSKNFSSVPILQI